MKTSENLNNDKLNKADIIALLDTTSQEDVELLYQKAKAIKQLYMGINKSKILSVQFSNHCDNKCIFCEFITDKEKDKFRLEPDEILDKINSIFCKEITNIILQSGVDSFYDTDMISYLIYKIKQEYNVEITLDLLQRDFNEYRAWKFSGADNYLLKFNTSNKDNFSIFTKENKLEERIEHLHYLKLIGYKICTGNIIGLPEQTLEDIADDLILLENIRPQMILNSIYSPYDSENKNLEKDFELFKKTTAITRLLLKKSNIIIPTLSSSITPGRIKELFKTGADTLMFEALIKGELKETSI
ncbi:MAG: [FeFe] hydrogenase H-cluster radical SAM maturase HydE [Ignavibacteriae bacterium]|nr:MAG: [FeFe] hydrogenase H-cluster radical SAM maturase HydE [Ignavibacteriota bacterium]